MSITASLTDETAEERHYKKLADQKFLCDMQLISFNQQGLAREDAVYQAVLQASAQLTEQMQEAEQLVAPILRERAEKEEARLRAEKEEAIGRRVIPTVTPVRVDVTEHTRCVIVECPFCGSNHVHGWPYGFDTIGNRVADCQPGGSYDIEVPDDYTE